MNVAERQPFIDRRFNEGLLPQLVDHVRVPTKLRSFDAGRAAHGFIDGG